MDKLNISVITILYIPYITIWLPYIFTSKVFKQRKQLIWNLKFHADTAAIFSQMNKTLNLQYHGIFCIIWCHIKVFTRNFHGNSVFPVIWWATGKEKPSRFLETVILCEAFRGNFKRKVGFSLYYHTISVCTCSCVCICLIFWFAYIAYYVSLQCYF